MSDGELVTPDTTPAPPGDTVPTPEPAPAPEPPKKKPRKPRRPLKQTLRLVFVRAYTLALFAGVATICAIAIVYLFRSVFTPAKLPESLAQWQGSIDAAALRQPHVAGVTDGAGRAPISHYHKVDRWYQADPHNTCTASGCHEPLPHTVKSRVAAFANMHVTFMDCRVCHEPLTGDTVPAHWVSTVQDTPQDVPAALRLIKMLEANGVTKENARDLHPQLVSLLKQTLTTVGHDAVIEDLLVQIETSVPGSPLWLKSVKRLGTEIPRHARGEYGAKIERRNPAGNGRQTASQTTAYLAAAPDSPERKGIDKAIHASVLLKPNACQACHGKPPGMLDLEGLGYSPKRAATLRSLPMASLMEQIRNGETFQLPKLIEVNDGR